MDKIMEKYCNKKAIAYMRNIDDNIALIVKPKPKWLPRFIYNSVIKNNIEILHKK